ncbi:hypothetical protein [Actinophytocola glycyrrhizae]|uniref:Uncharacterized protein n=1 Tax=Actinophytocola glycyrrhizae TaxID=2044873 RepID=A0ABV9SEN1_9PSEU
MTDHHLDRGYSDAHDGDEPNNDANNDPSCESTAAAESTSGHEDGCSADPAKAGRGLEAVSAPEQVSPARSAQALSASGREGIRAVLDAYLSTDLLHSGPGLLPFGRRARDRRARNQAVTDEARRRRAQLRLTAANLVENPRAAGSPTVRRTVERRSRLRVVFGLTAVVVAVALAALLWSSPEPVDPSTAVSQSPQSSGTGTFSTSTAVSKTGGTDAGSLPARPPIPPGGVTPLTPGPDTTVDPNSVQVVPIPTGPPTRTDLATPEAAMRAWLARLCPFTYTDPFGTAEQRARPAMTDNGWSTLNPLNGGSNEDVADQRARVSWDKTVAARESGRCTQPVAQISAEAPRTTISVIVIGGATRVITSTGRTRESTAASPYVEQLSEVRVVRRGTDGLWRIDLPTEGG